MKEFLFFKIDDQIYAADIAQIKSIEYFIPPTELPQTPDYVLGVIYIRGKIYSLIDLKKRLGGSFIALKNKKRLRLILLRRDEYRVALLVNEVLEVIRIKDDVIEPLPDFYRSSYKAKFLDGVIKEDNKFIIVINLDKLI